MPSFVVTSARSTGPWRQRFRECGAMFRTSHNQTTDGTRRGTSWWNSGLTIDKQWKRPGSHRKGVARRTTTRTVWTRTVRGGQLSTRSSSWIAETNHAYCRLRDHRDGREPAHRRYEGDALRRAPGRMPERDIPRVVDSNLRRSVQ